MSTLTLLEAIEKSGLPKESTFIPEKNLYKTYLEGTTDADISPQTTVNCACFWGTVALGWSRYYDTHVNVADLHLYMPCVLVDAESVLEYSDAGNDAYRVVEHFEIQDEKLPTPEELNLWLGFRVDN